MIRLIKEISATVRMANDIAEQSGSAGPRWSAFFTNRSFIAQVLSLVFFVLAVIGFPLSISADVAADALYGIICAAMMVWAGAERFYGKTRVIWTKGQASDALIEADALTRALKDAGTL